MEKIMQFEGFGKIGRLNKPCTITEKIDGTNAQICFGEEGEVLVGSRKRWIYPEGTNEKKGCDNYNFAQWVEENREKLFEYLGPGRYYGEWAGSGIQRNYGMSEKRFYLFNTFAFDTVLNPISKVLRKAGLDVVPKIYEGDFHFSVIEEAMARLKGNGSFIADFMNPEGIIIYHYGMRAYSKMTFHADKGKWTTKGRE
jgi:hypothetical protein